jgi:hypothetical protein
MDSSRKEPEQNRKPPPDPKTGPEATRPTRTETETPGSSQTTPRNLAIPVLFPPEERPTETPDSSQDEGSREPGPPDTVETGPSDPPNSQLTPDKRELTNSQDGGSRMPDPVQITMPDNTELKNYSAHGAVATQATAFLTYIITTVTVYVTVTGAAWGVVIANTFSASPTTQLCVLGLHILLSIGTAVGIWSVSNNFIQRLNLARWLGVVFWPHIQNLGGPGISWKGVPEDGTLKVLTYNKWKEDRSKKNKINWPLLGGLDFWLRYRAPIWPSLRHQRVWALLPIFAGAVSIVLFWQIRGDRYQHKLICDQAARTLSFPDNAPVPREVFDRARYLFEKTGCELSHIHLRPPGG